jgi:hypothetical protein
MKQTRQFNSSKQLHQHVMHVQSFDLHRKENRITFF